MDATKAKRLCGRSEGTPNGRRVKERLSRTPVLLRFAAVTVLTGVLAACDPLPYGPEPDLAVSGVAGPNVQPVERPDEAWLRHIGVEAPAFGGAFFDDAGTLVVWITAAEAREAVLSSVRRQFGKAAPHQPQPSTVARVGAFSFADTRKLARQARGSCPRHRRSCLR